MRSEMGAAATAMQALAEGVNGKRRGPGVHAPERIVPLATAAASEDLNFVHQEIHEAATGLEKSYQELERKNQLAWRSFRMRFARCNSEIAQERRTIYTDRISGLWIRPSWIRASKTCCFRRTPFCPSGPLRSSPY